MKKTKKTNVRDLKAKKDPKGGMLACRGGQKAPNRHHKHEQ